MRMKPYTILAVVILLTGCSTISRPRQEVYFVDNPVAISSSCKSITRIASEAFAEKSGRKTAIGLYAYRNNRNRNHVQAFAWFDEDQSWHPLTYKRHSDSAYTVGTYTKWSWLGNYGRLEGDPACLRILK